MAVEHAELELWVLSAQQGDRKAYARLYRALNRPLLRFAFSICGSQEAAQDAVQEAWLQMVKGLRQLRHAGAFRAWMYQRVRWLALDSRRQAARDVAVAPIEVGAELITAIEQSRDINAALARLPQTERQIIRLFYLDELSVAEIAGVLEIPAGTVKSRLSRARTMLQQRFEPKSKE